MKDISIDSRPRTDAGKIGMSFGSTRTVVAIAVAVAIVAFPLVSRANVAVQQGQITVANGVLAYRTLGAGPPIILLPGGFGVGSAYVMPVAQELAKTHRVILPDPPGMGLSRMNRYDAQTITLKAYMDDIDALRSTLQIEQVTVAGHSWGGGYAMTYAASYPSHVKALVLLDSVGPDFQWLKTLLRNSGAKQTPAEQVALAYWSDEKNKAADPEKAFFEWWKAQLPSFYYDRKKGEEINRSLKPEEYRARVGVPMLADLVKSYNVVQELNGSTVPALILQGREDPTGEETAAQLHALLANSKVEFVEHSGHFPWTEQPQAFFADIVGYLEEVGG